MSIKKIEKAIQKHYLAHGVNIKLKLFHINKNDGRIIFKVIIMPGTKLNGIFTHARDIQAALRIPLFQPFNHDLLVLLAISNRSIFNNDLITMLKSRQLLQNTVCLPIVLGRNPLNKIIFYDLAESPHALYAGSTNSGKSVALNCLIACLITTNPPNQVNLLLFDIGGNSIDKFKDVPHLSHPIVKDVETASYVMHELVREMEARIEFHNTLCDKPRIICVLDEFTALINGGKNKKATQALSNNISALLARGRHANIHIVLATQNPIAKNMNIDISNITTRIAFKCAKTQNSIAILNEGGAENLLGKGDMLCKLNGHESLIRLQGAFLSHDQITEIVKKTISVNPSCDAKFIIKPSGKTIDPLLEDSSLNLYNKDYDDSELADIIIWVLKNENVSAFRIKKTFSMGNRGSAILNELCELGIISSKDANKPRKVLPQSPDDIPECVLRLLNKHGHSIEEISTILEHKNQSQPNE